MKVLNYSLLGISICLGACSGGGGGAQVASTPTPPVTPPPPPPPSSAPPVKIFTAPLAGEYASIGASIAGPGGNLDTYPAPTSFGTISTADPQQAHIRYTSAGYYELQLPGSSFDRLVHYRGIVNPDSNNNYFEPQSTQMNRAFLVTRNARDQGYSYSELGGWGSQAASRWGYVAFGVPTPSGAVPFTGSASFDGLVSGSSDIMLPDNLYGGYYPLGVDGTVALNFDFGAGLSAGSMSLSSPMERSHCRSARLHSGTPYFRLAARPIREVSTRLPRVRTSSLAGLLVQMPRRRSELGQSRSSSTEVEPTSRKTGKPTKPSAPGSLGAGTRCDVRDCDCGRRARGRNAGLCTANASTYRGTGHGCSRGGR